MKHVTILLLCLIFSTSSFAVCIPDRTGNFSKFFGEVLKAGTYTGDRVEIQSITGSRPTAESLRGIYQFTRRTSTSLTLMSASCDPKPDGQCQQESEEIWRYSTLNRCFYVDGINVRITKSGSKVLRFDYTRGTKVIHANYQINETGNLVVNNTTEEPGRFEYVWFNGR